MGESESLCDSADSLTVDKRREARVAEYVDSPRLRLRTASSESRTVSARADSDYGNYRVWCDTAADRSGCSCPVGLGCKHIAALRRTWELNPGSFYVKPDKQVPGLPVQDL